MRPRASRRPILNRLLDDDGRVRLPQLRGQAPAAASVGGGFVTIWQSGRIAWQGPEEKTPARYLQETLDLDDGETPETGEG